MVVETGVFLLACRFCFMLFLLKMCGICSTSASQNLILLMVAFLRVPLIFRTVQGNQLLDPEKIFFMACHNGSDAVHFRSALESRWNSIQISDLGPRLENPQESQGWL